jgi:hypothetical protein
MVHWLVVVLVMVGEWLVVATVAGMAPGVTMAVRHRRR